MEINTAFFGVPSPGRLAAGAGTAARESRPVVCRKRRRSIAFMEILLRVILSQSMHGIQHLLPLLCLLFLPAAAPPASDLLAAKSQRGKELMAAGRYAEAVPVYRELVTALPANPGLLVNLGMALNLAGEDEQAIAPL